MVIAKAAELFSGFAFFMPAQNADDSPYFTGI